MFGGGEEVDSISAMIEIYRETILKVLVVAILRWGK